MGTGLSDAPRAEAMVAVQVEGQRLKETPHMLEPVAAPFEHLELGIQPFHKPAALAMHEVVSDQVTSSLQQFQEGVKAGEATPRHALVPEAEPTQPVSFRAGRIKDSDQL